MSRLSLGMTLLASLIGLTLRAEPVIRRVSVRGLQIGGTTTIVVEGSELGGPSPKLLGAPIGRQNVAPGGGPARQEFKVTIDKAADVGLYQLRLASQHGVSNPVTVGLDTLPQQTFANRVTSLPVALTGNLEGSRILTTEFDGKRGRRLVVEIESRRLGSSLRPVLRLLDPSGRQMTWSSARIALNGDARCEAKLPVDGVYSVQLHDLLYQGSAPGFFRLKIGELNYVDLAYPLGVTKGKQRSTGILSTSLAPLSEAAVAANLLGQRPLTLPSAPQLSGSRPRVIVSDHPEIVEGADDSQAVSAPAAFNGRISRAGEEDRFVLTVNPGAKLRFDVTARRAGSPLDGVLTLRGEQGNELSRNDDRPGSPDPQLDYAVPANIKKLTVGLRDLQGRGGEQFVYRIAIRDLAAPDYRLVLESDRLNVPEQGARVVRVRVNRSNFAGAIDLRVEGLPEGVVVAGDRIAAAANIGLLSFRVPEGVSGSGLIRIIGTGKGDNPLVRVARSNPLPGNRHQPWLRDEMAVGVSPVSPISIRWAKPNDQDKLLLGDKYWASIQVHRQTGVSGKVRLKLLTTQSPVKKKIKKNNKPVEVDDVDRMLRFEGVPILEANNNDASPAVLVPADLPISDWGVVIQAELLSADEKQVLVTTTTSARFLSTASPIAIQLSGDATVEAKAGGGPTGELKGVIRRAPGWVHPVTVTLSSLPKGYPAPKVVLPADATEFALPVRFPHGVKVGELKGVRLQAIYAADPKKPRQVVRSNALELVVRVTPGEKTKPADQK